VFSGNKKIKDIFSTITVSTSLAASLVSVVFRLPEISSSLENLKFLAVKSIAPHGDLISDIKEPERNFIKNKTENQEETVPELENYTQESQIEIPEEKEDLLKEEEEHKNEKKYKIIESQFGASGIHFENFYVKNSAGYNLDINSELKKCPDIKIKRDGKPEVLIIHTHTCEAYMEKDRDFYYESFYPRSTDINKNVARVGDAVEKKLKNAGIEVIHDVTCHDEPSFKGCYDRSAETIKKNLEKYPSIQVVLDLHRDSIGDKEQGQIKPTFKVNGKKAAQIMIISGYDKDGSKNFKDWEYNLRFALRLQKAAEDMYPGMTRPLYFDEVRYNMHLTHGSLLIEVGSEVNTLKEAVYTGSLLGDVLTKVLNELAFTS